MAENPIDIRTGKPATDAEMRRRAKVADALRVKKTRPASGTPASGLPATGSGWGGEAKGSSATAGDLTSANAAPRRTADELAALAAQALQVMVDVMTAEDSPAAIKLMAAEKIVNRIEGTPIARTITDSQPIAQPLALVAKYPKAVNE